MSNTIPIPISAASALVVIVFIPTSITRTD